MDDVDLERALDDLQNALPALACDEAADFDLLAFQREAAKLIAALPAEEKDAATGRINYMLQQAGLGGLPAR